MEMVYQVKYNNDEFEFEHDNEEYRCSVQAEADWYHEDPVYYYKDGSGYPGDDNIEVTKVTIKQLEKRGDHGWESVSITDDIECTVTYELCNMDLDEWKEE